MAQVTRKTHVSPPLMHAFRAAHEAGDATSKIELRTNDGDRIIAGRNIRQALEGLSKEGIERLPDMV